MKRYLIVASVAILAGVLVWLGLGAPLVGGPGLLESQPIEDKIDFLENPDKYCDVHDPACRDLVQQVLEELNRRPTPRPVDPKAKEVLLGDPAIQAMIGEGREGEDYWLRLSPKRSPWMGGEGANADIVFAKPVSYEGEVWVTSNPCAGQSDEGYVDPEQPCYSEAPEYRKEHWVITNTRVIQARVDISPGVVTGIMAWHWEEDDIESLKEAIIEHSSAAP